MKETFIVFTLLAFGLVHGCKDPISQWRGTDRDGIYHETGLLDSWPENGPELLWVAEGLGRGYAAPVVAEDKIFINGELEGKSYLFAFDLEGKQLWKSPNGNEFLGEGFSSTYPGARSTPTVMGHRVYASSGTGRIACFNIFTGAGEWGVSIVDDLEGEVGYFGYSESVAADDKKIYCFPGGNETNMAALDRFTGKTVWTSELLRDTFAYGSPVVVDLPSRKIVIATSRHHLFTVDCKNGALLGTYKLAGYEYDGEHCNTPVYSEGYVYFVANDEKGQGAVRLQLSEDGKNIKEVWRNQEIQNNFGGLLAINHHLLTTIKGNRLVSLEPETGAIADSIKVASGSLAYADGKVICYGNNGTIQLVNYRQDKLEVTGRLKVSEGTGNHFSYPVVASGIMYIRHGNALMAYQIK